MDDPQGVEVGRFDGPSGPPDILVAGDVCTNSFSGNCQTLLVGMGTALSRTLPRPTPPSSSSITSRGPVDDAPIDLNGDGAHPTPCGCRPTATARPATRLQVTLNNGAGGFGTPRTWSGPWPPTSRRQRSSPPTLTGSGPPTCSFADHPSLRHPQCDRLADRAVGRAGQSNSSGTFETGQGEFQVPITGSSQGWSQADESTVVGDFRRGGN